MKICNRAINFVQIVNADGDVRLCSWQKDGGIIGRLTDSSMHEIYHSTQAELIKSRHLNHDYSNCNVNTCPFVANENFADGEVEIEKLPDLPSELYLAFENTCNYHCRMCGIPGCMAHVDKKKLEEKYAKICQELKKILPYVTKISANGLGELFASPHTLELLATWQPIANDEDVSVTLETNGSLFNEKNWAKIANLGKYNLSVAITVLSFEEKTYQYLSGTKLPISNIEANLHFVKSLREQGIINYLELATVYQERNFRTLPEFARRCVEEFGVDYVRLRPFEPWKEVGMDEWFMDVRNAYHPYHQEFLEVMEDPIFKHPKVHDWGGGKNSGLGPVPFGRAKAERDLLAAILLEDNFPERMKKWLGTEQVIVYAMSLVGKALVKALAGKMHVLYALDRSPKYDSYAGIPVYGIGKMAQHPKEAPVLIALTQDTDGPRQMLQDAGYSRGVYTVEEMMNVL